MAEIETLVSLYTTVPEGNMGHLRNTAYYWVMVDFIFKPMAEIYYHVYGLIKIFVILDKDIHISPKIFVEKNVIFWNLEGGAGYMGQRLCIL